MVLATDLPVGAVTTPHTSLNFLAGGGEMGARIRAFDWARTPLGRPEQWPQSLKTIVRVMLDSRYAMWMLWGPELTFFCNDAYLPTVGLKRDWVLGARSDKVWEEIWPDIGPRITQVLSQGKATWDEGLLLFLERSGFAEETYHTFSYSPVYDDESRIAGMLCVVTEVTERVIGERRLRTLRELAACPAGSSTVEEACQRLMDVLADDPLDVPFALLYVLDGANQGCRLMGYCGLLPASLCPAEIATASASLPWPIFEVMRGGEACAIELPPSEPIQSSLWPDLVRRGLMLPVQGQATSAPVALLITGTSPRRSLDENYRSFLTLVAGQFAAVIADAQAHEAERRRAAALTEIDRAKTIFFSNVSHEFRTPLTLMLGPIEEAATHPSTPAAVRTQLDLAQRNSLRLLKLVNSLLDFSRIEAGRMQASYQASDFSALTRDLASTFRSAVERAGLRFDVGCEPLDEPVYLDRDMWEKIVLNLLSNAFKFTLEGCITVRTCGDGGQALLEVTDTGVGIPTQELPRLFERFHRVENTRARTQEGSGIGLALVHELVRLHGGEIDVASRPEKGTTFQVRIPLGTQHLAADRIRATPSLASTATGAQSFVQEALRWLPVDAKDGILARLPAIAEESPSVLDPRSMLTSGARIVLADDNADMRLYVRELLAPLYEVVAVVDGQQALEAIRRDVPDLILSDMMMPHVDGFALLKAVREDEALSQIPFIMLSARAGEEARIEGLEAGADDYLIKPFSARELLARVSGSLMLARERRLFQQRVAADLAAMTRLRQLGELCVRSSHQLQRCLEEILDAAISVTAADKGNVQLLDPKCNALKIAAHKGLGQPFLNFFATVQAAEAASCGAALLAGDRVVVEAVQQSELFAGTAALEVLLEQGIQAVQSTPLVSSAGKVLGIISTHFERPHRLGERELRLMDLLARQAADYLERRQTDEALRASEIRLRTILDASPAALTLLSAVRGQDDQVVDFRWSYLNKPAQKAICERIDKAAEELIGRRITEVLPGSWDSPGLLQSFVRAMESGETQATEAISSSPGIAGTFLNLAAPFDDGVLVWFIDITAQKEAERLLRQADIRKNEFLAMLAHELRNPLAPIANASEILSLALPADARARPVIGMIKRQVTHLTRLVDDLLDVSRITQGRIQLQREPIDVAAVITQAIETLGPQLREKGHELSVVNSNYEPLFVNGDFTRLVQCVSNILGNATKYTESRGDIRIDTRSEGSSVIIEVTDTGAGIPIDLLPHIFDLFTQSSRTLDRSQGGLGIGLSVVKLLVEMHDGRVTARSPGPGGGSTFQIRLPRVARLEAPAADSLPVRSPPRRVLIVDDNADAANSLAMLLRLGAHEIEVAYSAQEALERVRSFRPDFALLDIGLPEMDGYELALRLRSDPTLNGLRLVALTGYGQAEDRQRAKAVGFDDHLVKPVELQVLERTLAG